MASAQVTLVGGTISSFVIPNPCGRVVATMISGAAETYVTADGSSPATPTGTPAAGTQCTIAGVVGAQAVLQPPLPGSVAPGQAGPGGASLPQIQLLSAGTPVIEVAW